MGAGLGGVAIELSSDDMTEPISQAPLTVELGALFLLIRN